MKRTKPATPPKRTIDLSVLHRALEQAAEELRSAEEAAIHALNMRRAARAKHLSTCDAFKQAVETVRLACTVTVMQAD